MNFLKSTVFIFFALLIFSCSKKDTTAPKSSLNSIKSFVITSTTPNVSGVIDTVAHTVKLTMPIGTDATSLIPTITVSPLATISPATGVKQDFSKNVTYTVTAENGTVAPYTVTTTVQKSSENAMLTFAFAGLSPAVSGVLDAAGTTVNVTVPSGTNVKTLVPTITISPRATISPLTGIAQDFTNAVPYIITAENGTTRTVNVKVSVAAATGNNETVYVGQAYEGLYAINALTGKLKWKYTIGASVNFGGTSSSPIISDGVAYYGGYDGKLYAIDITTGAKIWSFTTLDIITSSPIVANGIVYVGSYDGGKLYAIDAIKGIKKWSFTVTGATIVSSPTVANGIVYIASTDGNLFAVDATTGSKKWIFNGGFSSSSPLVSNGVVYVGSEDKNLYAIDAATGTKKWSFKSNDYFNSSPTIDNGVIFVGSWDNNLYAIDAATGTKKWSFMTGSKIDSSPTVANGVVYVGSDDGNLYAIDAVAGTKKWSFNTPSSTISSSPTVANGIVYIGSSDGSLNAIDAKTGVKKWEVLSLGYIDTSPCVVTSDGKVYRGLGNIHP